MTITRHPRAERFPYIWATICVLLVACAASLGVALYGATKANDSLRAAQDASKEAKAAALHAQAISDCINTNLGTRQLPAQADAAANLEFIVAVTHLFAVPPNATPQQRLAAGQRFQAIVEDVRVTLLADKREKAAHPLGRC